MKVQVVVSKKPCEHKNLTTLKQYDKTNFLVCCEDCKGLFGFNEKIDLLLQVGVMQLG